MHASDADFCSVVFFSYPQRLAVGKRYLNEVTSAVRTLRCIRCTQLLVV